MKTKIHRDYYVQYRIPTKRGKLGSLKTSKWFTKDEARKFAIQKQSIYSGGIIANIIDATNPMHHDIVEYIDLNYKVRNTQTVYIDKVKVPFSIRRAVDSSQMKVRR